MDAFLPDDIYRVIFNLLDFLSQINFKCTSTYFHHNYPITNLYDNVPKHKLAKEILELYPHATQFDAKFLYKISNLNYLTNLQILNARGHNGWVGNNFISGLTNLTHLDISNNMYITDLSHLCQLRFLMGPKKLTNQSISTLTNLTTLGIDYNNCIDNLNYLVQLRTLYANCNSVITNKGISELTNLTKLSIDCNPHITDINSLCSLRILHAEENCGVGDRGISKLTNLIKMNARFNFEITGTSFNMIYQNILRLGGVIQFGLSKAKVIIKIDGERMMYEL
jgi:hypothetical protein